MPATETEAVPIPPSENTVFENTVHVLVVDDHAGFLDAAARVVEATEAFVMVGAIESGEAALAFLSGEEVDLLILDLRLGDEGQLDGIGTVQRYASGGGEARISLMSTTQREDLPDGALDAVDHFFPKEEFLLRALDHLWRVGIRENPQREHGARRGDSRRGRVPVQTAPDLASSDVGCGRDLCGVGPCPGFCLGSGVGRDYSRRECLGHSGPSGVSAYRRGELNKRLLITIGGT